jgi:hypothetical protein
MIIKETSIPHRIFFIFASLIILVRMYINIFHLSKNKELNLRAISWLTLVLFDLTGYFYFE